MPKIERSVDYTFQAYSGTSENKKEQLERSESPKFNDHNLDVKGSDSENESKSPIVNHILVHTIGKLTQIANV